MNTIVSAQAGEHDGAGERSVGSVWSAPVEKELKFQVRRSDLKSLRAMPIFAHRPAVKLRSVYFDTPGRDLHRAGFSLRVREMNGVFLQTVKSSGGRSLFDRAEWESVIGSGKPDRLAWKGTAIAHILKGTPKKSLCPIFTTTVVRNIGVIEEGDNVVEVSIDEGRVEVGACSEPILELELELKSGDQAALFAVAHRLSAHAVLRLSFVSKAERGYRLIELRHAVAYKARSVEISRKTSAAEAFPVVVCDCLNQIAANAELLLKARDSEVLHQLRIGLRRLRTAFNVFNPILSRDDIARLTAEAKWVASKLDEARNLDVLIENMRRAVEAAVQDKTETDGTRAALIAAREAAYKQVRSAIDSKRFAALLLDCAVWVELDRPHLATEPAMKHLLDGDAKTFASQALGHLRHQVRKHGKHLRTLDPEARHRVRIKAKNMRYAVEFFAGCFAHRAQKRPHKKFVAALSKLQDTLGELNDQTSAKSTISKAIGGQGNTALNAVQLLAEPDTNELKLLQDAAAAFKKWHRIKPFWRKIHSDAFDRAGKSIISVSTKPHSE
jgi:triphosphatase